MDKFKFGKNWNNYIKKYLNNDRLEKAKTSLVNFTGLTDFKGKTFIDIGCGSGLFSLAAFKLGATKIVSLDVDEDSVACCQILKKREGNPNIWEVVTGDALDQSFIQSLGTFDIVYSWGVLHHTGNMWKAIDNVSKLTGIDGLFYLAIYNKADGLCFHPDGRPGSSLFWLKFKKWFVHKSDKTQTIITNIVAFVQILSYILKLKNPYTMIKNHSKDFRGMSWKIDIKDWLGGYPYEYASVSRIFKFLKKRNFILINLINNNGLRNNEFLFKKGRKDD